VKVSLELDLTESERHERAIRALIARSGVSPLEVRARFGRELARLQLNARVRSYLTLLTSANVLTALRREHGLTSAADHQ